MSFIYWLIGSQPEVATINLREFFWQLA